MLIAIHVCLNGLKPSDITVLSIQWLIVWGKETADTLVKQFAVVLVFIFNPRFSVFWELHYLSSFDPPQFTETVSEQRQPLILKGSLANGSLSLSLGQPLAVLASEGKMGWEPRRGSRSSLAWLQGGLYEILSQTPNKD